MEADHVVSVSIAELRSVLNAILDAAESELGETVDLETDYYWHLQSDNAFDMTTTPSPSALTAGQLSDDVLELKQVAANGVTSVWHDLDHANAILKRIAYLSLNP